MSAMHLETIPVSLALPCARGGHLSSLQSLLGMLGDWAARKIIEGSGHLRAVGKVKLWQNTLQGFL